ncbi:MAG: NmrA/HSCARG family protein [Bryobacterales bacterium]|nr:NmrA/HSCARG family protein [Bryobacterales bacterium]
MADKKIIAVLGATGAQGGGLVRAIQADEAGEFRTRALTRNPASEKARALAELGAEVVAADADDEASLRAAFDGAWGAYCVTNYWEHRSPEKEVSQVAALARSAKAANLKHVIWSTLEDSRKWIPLDDPRMPTLFGKYKVPHFDAKGESDHFFTDAHVPVTFLLASFYWENFINSGLRRGPDGVPALTFPLGNEPMASIGVEDIGRCAYGIFKNSSHWIGRTAGLAGEHLTMAEMAAIFTEVLGEQVRYNEISPEVFRSFPIPGADDLGNMFQFYRDFSAHFRESRPLAVARALNPKMQSFREWLRANIQRIPIT